MKSVGMAAQQMVETCRKQFKSPDGMEVLAGTKKPEEVEGWYSECIQVATASSLEEMVAPSPRHVLPSRRGHLLREVCSVRPPRGRHRVWHPDGAVCFQHRWCLGQCQEVHRGQGHPGQACRFEQGRSN